MPKHTKLQTYTPNVNSPRKNRKIKANYSLLKHIQYLHVTWKVIKRPQDWSSGRRFTISFEVIRPRPASPQATCVNEVKRKNGCDRAWLQGRRTHLSRQDPPCLVSTLAAPTTLYQRRVLLLHPNRNCTFQI